MPNTVLSMLEVYPLFTSFSVFTPTFLNKPPKLVSYYQCSFLDNSDLALLRLCHSASASWLPYETGCSHAPPGAGLGSCLLSPQPSVAARTPRDESPELSNFGEIPCLLYLDITEAKGTVGQQIGGRPLRH